MCQELRLRKFQDQLKAPFNKSLLAFHVNINGIKTNFESLTQFICLNENGPDVICISETHIPTQLPNISNKSYQYKSFCVPKHVPENLNNRTGVAIYVKSNLRSKERNDLSKVFKLEKKTKAGNEEVDFVCLWIELVDNVGKEVVIGVVYRHPNNDKKDFERFRDLFSPILEKLNKEKKTFYVLGDFNIDFSTNSAHFEEFNEKCKCKQLISKVTRIESKTLLDHIYTNDKLINSLKIGVVQTNEISDHYPIYCFIPNSTFANEVENNLLISFETLLSLKSNLTTIEIPKKPEITTPELTERSCGLQNKIKSVWSLFEKFLKEINTLISDVNDKYKSKTNKKQPDSSTEILEQKKNLIETLCKNVSKDGLRELNKLELSEAFKVIQSTLNISDKVRETYLIIDPILNENSNNPAIKRFSQNFSASLDLEVWKLKHLAFEYLFELATAKLH